MPYLENCQSEMTCKDCGVTKPLDEFARGTLRGRVYIKARCRPCYNSKSSPRNKEWRTSSDYIKRRAIIFRELIQELKGNTCSVCGGVFPSVCLDFHHLGGDKDFNLSSGSWSRSKDTILAEAEKCVVVCSNCHRVIHWEG